jgi:hypothetical protein
LENRREKTSERFSFYWKKQRKLRLLRFQHLGWSDSKQPLSRYENNDDEKNSNLGFGPLSDNFGKLQFFLVPWKELEHNRETFSRILLDSPFWKVVRKTTRWMLRNMNLCGYEGFVLLL